MPPKPRKISPVAFMPLYQQTPAQLRTLLTEELQRTELKHNPIGMQLTLFTKLAPVIQLWVFVHYLVNFEKSDIDDFFSNNELTFQSQNRNKGQTAIPSSEKESLTASILLEKPLLKRAIDNHFLKIVDSELKKLPTQEANSCQRIILQIIKSPFNVEEYFNHMRSVLENNSQPTHETIIENLTNYYKTAWHVLNLAHTVDAVCMRKNKEIVWCEIYDTVIRNLTLKRMRPLRDIEEAQKKFLMRNISVVTSHPRFYQEDVLKKFRMQHIFLTHEYKIYTALIIFMLLLSAAAIHWLYDLCTTPLEFNKISNVLGILFACKIIHKFYKKLFTTTFIKLPPVALSTDFVEPRLLMEVSNITPRTRIPKSFTKIVTEYNGNDGFSVIERSNNLRSEYGPHEKPKPDAQSDMEVIANNKPAAIAQLLSVSDGDNRIPIDNAYEVRHLLGDIFIVNFIPPDDVTRATLIDTMMNGKLLPRDASTNGIKLYDRENYAVDGVVKSGGVRGLCFAYPGQYQLTEGEKTTTKEAVVLAMVADGARKNIYDNPQAPAELLPRLAPR